MARSIDLRDKRFHGWTVEARVAPSALYVRTYQWWRCRCDCGRTAVLRGIDLRSGTSRACHNNADPVPLRASCHVRLWDEHPCLNTLAGHSIHFYDIRASRLAQAS